MMTSRLALIAALSGIAVLTPATALADDPVADILACRAIEPIEARLACFDSAAATLASAHSSGDIVTVMREDVEAVERDSFGFSMPSLPRFRVPLLAGRAEANVRDANTLVAAADAASSSGETAAASAATPSPAPAATSDTATAAATDVQILDRGADGNVDRVMMTIARTRTVGYNTTIFYMENGQVWRQKDDLTVRLPRNTEGLTAEIRRGAMSSFLLRVNGRGRAIAVERQR
ncbi:hypothetical protein [uncultured Maricaulis sp.]|uniref:hypothetical protein n=1 Tax=uncultured Maricaulis sp. TaxID=174710 RepID=UPI0030DC63C5|tara:strand:- start:784 stop:1485 length:702 start_codon:yes stop_codon:yes gene_type:complete